jgi:hypothetical protein
MQPQLNAITTLTATLELVTGLRIGAGDSEMHIGGVDNTVIKHPHTPVALHSRLQPQGQDAQPAGVAQRRCQRRSPGLERL